MYIRFAQRWLADQPGLQEVQREFLLEALKLYRELADDERLDPSILLASGLAEFSRRRESTRSLGDLPSAKEPLERAFSIFRDLNQSDPSSLEYRAAWRTARPNSGTSNWHLEMASIGKPTAAR